MKAIPQTRISRKIDPEIPLEDWPVILWLPEQPAEKMRVSLIN